MSSLQSNNSTYITAFRNNDKLFYVPASTLDGVLHRRNANVEANYLDFTGNELNSSNIISFQQQVIVEREAAKYSTTDHLPIVVTIQTPGGPVYFVYISLDNSVRANMNGHPLYERLGAICDLVKSISSRYNNRCVFFFSESSRPSFLGGMNERSNLRTWFSMRRHICQECGLDYIGEKRNNDDSSDMAFGVSAFVCPNICDNIATSIGQTILTEGTGSIALGVKLTSGEIVWAIHFPLDFKNKLNNNYGYIAMTNLQSLLANFEGSVCAFGDFNTVPGNPGEAVSAAVQSGFTFAQPEFQTFYGAHYDGVSPYPGENWVPLIA